MKHKQVKIVSSDLLNKVVHKKEKDIYGVVEEVQGKLLLVKISEEVFEFWDIEKDHICTIHYEKKDIEEIKKRAKEISKVLGGKE